MKATRPSSSAQTVALARAHLDWLGAVDDPLAVRMLTPRRRLVRRLLRLKLLRAYARSAGFSFLAARTKFFDEAIHMAVAEGVKQVVIVGAGYDTRGWRLQRPGVTFFEADHPATQQDKARRAPTGGVTFVAVDLVRHQLADRLVAAGFDSEAPAVFVIEGLTMYLSEEVALTMFRALESIAAPGSRLTANFTSEGGGSMSPISRGVAWAIRASWSLTGEPAFHWATSDRVEPLLSSSGWHVVEKIAGPDLAKRYLDGTKMDIGAVSPNVFCIAATTTPESGARVL